MSNRITNIAIINSIVARNDAISASVIDTYRSLKAINNFKVSLFCYKNDYGEVDSNDILSIEDLLFHPDFLDADIILWHFGVTYELFNAVLVGNGHARRVVCFHNVTPKEFVPSRFWQTIDRSFQQCHLLREADEIWAVSGINAEVARGFGVDPARIQEMPLAVETVSLQSFESKPLDLVRILFVGRFVPSKGILDLLKSVVELRETSFIPFAVDLVGNVSFSDPDYISEVRALVKGRALDDIVTMHGTVDDAALADFYAAAHILAIPSYHEGFCKPVIEALRASCIPVGYSAYNLPYVANGFGRLVEPGNIPDLSRALRDVVEALPKAHEAPLSERLPLDRGMLSLREATKLIAQYVESFSVEAINTKMISRLEYLAQRAPEPRLASALNRVAR